jgi:hypothetical protein
MEFTLRVVYSFLRYTYTVCQFFFFFAFFHVFLCFLAICCTIIFMVLCLFSFHCQLLYVDSLNVISLDDLDLPEAEFAINRWSRENIDKILLLDVIDKHIYGKPKVIILYVRMDYSCDLLVVTFDFTGW